MIWLNHRLSIHADPVKCDYTRKTILAFTSYAQGLTQGENKEFLAGYSQNLGITTYFFDLRETEKYSYLKFVIHIVIITAYLGLSLISFAFRTKSASEAKGHIGGLGI